MVQEHIKFTKTHAESDDYLILLVLSYFSVLTNRLIPYHIMTRLLYHDDGFHILFLSCVLLGSFSEINVQHARLDYVFFYYFHAFF